MELSPCAGASPVPPLSSKGGLGRAVWQVLQLQNYVQNACFLTLLPPASAVGVILDFDMATSVLAYYWGMVLGPGAL